MAVDKLIKFSGGKYETAKQILENTFEKSYEGFFPLSPDYNKQKNNGKGLETNR